MLVKFPQGDTDIWVDVMRVVALEVPPGTNGCYIKLHGGYEVTDPDGYPSHVHRIDNGYYVTESIDEVAVKINAMILEVRRIGIPYMTVNPYMPVNGSEPR